MKKFFGFIMDVYSIIAGYLLLVNLYVVAAIDDIPGAFWLAFLALLLLVFAIIALVRLLIPKIEEKVMEIIVFSISCVFLILYIFVPFMRENIHFLNSYFWFSLPVVSGILYLSIKGWY